MRETLPPRPPPPQTPPPPRHAIHPHTAGDQSINFQEFVAGLSTFTTRAKQAEKAKFSFKMYDFNG